MINAAATQNPKYPHAALIPTRTAPAAPGNETIARVCPTKLCWRSTTNQPISAATPATIVPARNALTMKWNSKSCRRSEVRSQLNPSAIGIVDSVGSAGRVGVEVRVVARGLGVADHDETAVAGVQHLDRCRVEARQRGAGDDVVWSPDDAAAPGEIDDAVEVRQDGVDVVGDDDHRQPFLAADAVHQRRD